MPIHAADMLAQVVVVKGLLLPQLGDARRVVVHFDAGLQRIDRMVRVVREPELLHRNANVRVVFQAEPGEFFDPFVRHPDRRERKHVDLAGASAALAVFFSSATSQCWMTREPPIGDIPTD